MIHPALPNPDQIARQRQGGCRTLICYGDALRIVIGESKTYAIPRGVKLEHEDGSREIAFFGEGNGQGPEAA